MNAVIATITRGTRSRSSPARIWGIVVVDASTIDAATPMVPLTTMFHAAQSPASERLTPSTSTRGPRPTIGRSRANTRNGTSMTSRRTTDHSGTRPITAASATRPAWTPNAQNCSRGVATTAKTNSTVAASLHCAGRRCSGPGSWINRWRWALMTSSAGPADDEHETGADDERRGNTGKTGDPRPHEPVVDTTHPVVGEGPVGERVGARPAVDALVGRDLLQPVGVRVGVGGEEDHQRHGRGNADEDERHR